MLWSGWGDPDRAAPLPAAVAGLVSGALGLPVDQVSAPVELDQVRLPAPALPPARLADLSAVVGAEHVGVTAEDRIRHTRGKSTVDLLRIRAGDAADAPDAVVRPASHDEVLAVLRVAAEHRIAVVPFGGGTSVVGGLAPDRAGFAGVISLDLARLDRVLAIDPVSRTATLEPGLRATAATAALAEHGFTLGHYPQSYEWATIGGFAATRSSGQFSAGYGRFDEMVVGLRVATPEGTLDLGRAPRSAAGPDLRQLFLGSEGALGVLTAVTVRLRPTPAQQVVEGWRFADFATGVTALRRLAQDGPLPTVLRLSDEVETMVNARGVDGCLAIVGFEGTDVADVRARAGAVLAGAGGTPLGEQPGEAWLRGRFAAPYLRDSLLGAGAFAETVETAGFWSAVPALYDGVRTALVEALAAQGTPPIVLCHVSHVYETGASLYFTVVCAQAADPVTLADPVRQWGAAKAAASRAIAGHGGTITHHHAVGVDHRAGLAEEIGPLAVDVLRQVKARLDPVGILNPGILVT